MRNDNKTLLRTKLEQASSGNAILNNKTKSYFPTRDHLRKAPMVLEQALDMDLIMNVI